jgi:hypothetical protein
MLGEWFPGTCCAERRASFEAATATDRHRAGLDMCRDLSYLPVHLGQLSEQVLVRKGWCGSANHLTQAGALPVPLPLPRQCSRSRYSSLRSSHPSVHQLVHVGCYELQRSATSATRATALLDGGYCVELTHGFVLGPRGRPRWKMPLPSSCDPGTDLRKVTDLPPRSSREDGLPRIRATAIHGRYNRSRHVAG